MAPPEVSDRDVPSEQVVGQIENDNSSWFTTGSKVFEAKYQATLLPAEQSSSEAEKSINQVVHAWDQSGLKKTISTYRRFLPTQAPTLPSVRNDRETEINMTCDSPNKERVDTEEEQSNDLHGMEICVNSSDSPSQNDPVKDTVPEANVVGGDSSCKSAPQVKESVLPLKCASVIQEEGTDSAKIRLLTMKGPTHNLKVFPEVGEKMVDDRPSLTQQQAKCELPAKVANNTVANNSRLVIDQLCTPGLELVICGNYREENKWKAGVTYFSVEKFINELSQIASNDKLTFGGYKEEPPPPLSKQAPPPIDILATSKDLCLKYEDSLIKNETTAHNDQRSNRNRKKAEKAAPSCGLASPSSGSAICPDERRSVPIGKHPTEYQFVRYQSGPKQLHPIEKQGQGKQTQYSSHHSSKPISGEPSDSTQSSSNSQSKNGGNGSNCSSTQHKKRGGASNQGGGTLGGGSGSGEENDGGLPPDDHGKKSQSVASQANEKEESSVPEPVFKKVANQQVCSKPPPASPAMPGTEVQSPNPSAVICDDPGGQSRLKPPPNTLVSPGAEDIYQNPPVANPNLAAIDQPRSYFNVKPPPDSQASHGAKVSSRLLSETAWDEPNQKHSASASVLEDTRRDSLDFVATPPKDFRSPLTPATQLIDEKPPPDNELPWTNIAPDRIAEDLASNDVVPIEESPSLEPQMIGLPSPALPTHVSNNLNLLSVQESELNAEFCLFPFASLAGDDDLLPPQPSSGEEATLDSVGNTHDFYQHPIEEVGNLEPERGHPIPQEGAINDALTHTTLGSHVVSPLHDIWIFIALVDISGPINEGER